MIYALRHYTLPILAALGLHIALVWALYQGWNPEKELLNFIKPQTVMAHLIVLAPKAPVAPPAKVNTAQRKAEKQAAAAKALAAKKRRDEQQELEQLKKAAERAAAAKKADAQQEADAQREAAALRARQERLARLSELAADSMERVIADESADLQAGTEEMVVRSYHAAIYDLVRRNWSRPPSSRTGMQARLQVELIPTGEVIAVTVVEPSGNGAFDQSAVRAVRSARRFEVPPENALFEKHFRRFYFLFQPEDLLR